MAGYGADWTNNESTFHHSTCSSPYPSRDDLTDNERMALLISFALLTPMTLVLNGFLIFGLYKTKQHRHVFSRFILVLSMSDFCIGLIVQPTVIYLFMPHTSNNCNASWFMTITAYTFINFSGLVIFMVSIDRFFRLRKSQGYVHRVTLQNVNLALFGAFVFSVTTAFGAYLSTEYGFFCYYNMVVIIINAIAAGGILFFYLMAWRNVRNRISVLRHLPAPRASKSSSTVNLSVDREEHPSPLMHLRVNALRRWKSTPAVVGVKKNRRSYDASMTRTVAAILICCCTTYPPYFAVTFYRSFTFSMEGHCDRKSHSTNLFFFWAFFLMFVNSLVNSILYSCHNRELKKLLKSFKDCGKKNFKSSALNMSNVTNRTAIRTSKTRPALM